MFLYLSPANFEEIRLKKNIEALFSFFNRKECKDLTTKALKGFSQSNTNELMVND
jgi:hypothetical protein